MGRAHHQKTRDRNKQNLPQTPGREKKSYQAEYLYEFGEDKTEKKNR
ncbi:YfhD family protein [Salirhabdus salicampi]|nr:YfhD family protein [Salirhabdus salicampi]MCP8617792.1 YfhD family protein [Salirhabdus salicampi]